MTRGTDRRFQRSSRAARMRYNAAERLINIGIRMTLLLLFWPTSTKPQAWILRKNNNGCNGCNGCSLLLTLLLLKLLVKHPAFYKDRTVLPATKHEPYLSTFQLQSITIHWLVLIATTHGGTTKLNWHMWLITYRDEFSGTVSLTRIRSLTSTLMVS